MLFGNFRTRWDSLVAKEGVFTKLTVVQAGALLALSLVLLFKGHTTVIMPPRITDKVVIDATSADSNYKKSWGMFMAELMGNLTPESVDTVKKWLSTSLTPELYARLRESIEEQAQKIKEEGFTVSFSPTQVIFEADTDRVFVNGTSVTTSRDLTSKRVDRTYEFVVSIRGYSPVVTDFDVYRGEPHTADWKIRNPGWAKEAQKAAEAPKQ